MYNFYGQVNSNNQPEGHALAVHSTGKKMIEGGFKGKDWVPYYREIEEIEDGSIDYRVFINPTAKKNYVISFKYDQEENKIKFQNASGAPSAEGGGGKATVYEDHAKFIKEFDYREYVFSKSGHG